MESRHGIENDVTVVDRAMERPEKSQESLPGSVTSGWAAGPVGSSAAQTVVEPASFESESQFTVGRAGERVPSNTNIVIATQEGSPMAEHTKNISTVAERREFIPELSWQDVTEPGAYVELGTGDLYRIPKEALLSGASP